MDLRKINYFIAVYEEGSVTRAAMRLNVVQPALSAQIAQLESELEQKLFDRTSRKMVPTPAGKTLHQLVVPIQRDLAAAQAHMANLKGKMLGSVTIGILASVIRSAVPSVMLDFYRSYPNVVVSVADGYSQNFIEWVNAGALDIAIINRPPRKLALSVQPFLEEEMVVVAASSMPAPKLSDASGLGRLKLVLPSKRHGLRQELERHTQNHLADLNPRMEMDSIEAIADLVAQSDWFSVLPSIAVHRYLLDGTLTAYSIGHARIKRDLVIIHQPRHPPSQAAQLLIGGLQRELRKTKRSLRNRIIASGNH